jgi:hypothetical protein
VAVGEQRLAERRVFGEWDWLRRSRFRPHEPAVGPIHITTADGDDATRDAGKASSRCPGVVVAHRKHVQYNLWRRITQAGWKVKDWYAGARAVDVPHR